MSDLNVHKDGELKRSTPFQYKELPDEPRKRPCVSDDVWDHAQFSSWKGTVWNLIEDFATAEVVKSFLADPPNYVVCDDLSWLDEIVYRVRGEVIDSKAVMAERLRGRYRAIRAVHGTRTADVDQFYLQGLKPLNPEDFHCLARSLFLQGTYPELSEGNLQAAIQQVGGDLREGRVFFEANEEMLRSYCGHYLIYGSEYLAALAANLGGNRDYRQVLTRQGIPTMFVCDVPLELVSDQTLSEFAGEALEALFQELLDGENYERDPCRGAGFCIYSSLPPSFIVGHYHPESIRDPLLGFT